jgi:hypothetical protein
MPIWPPRPGHRTITLGLSAAQIQHLDDQATFQGRTRAAQLRHIIATHRDRSRSPAITAPELAGNGKRTVTFELPIPLIAYLDSLATANHCSRAAAIRSIVSADIRRQGPVAANSAAGA